MKKNNYPILLIILIIQLIVNGCKEKEKKIDVWDVEQRLKDWMFFDTGSYWVYKEINNNYRDSQYVLRSYSNYMEGQTSPKPPIIDKVQNAYVELNNGYSIHLASMKGSSEIEKIAPEGEAGSTYLFFKELYVGGDGSGGGGYIKAIDYAYQFGNIKDTLITFYNSLDYSEKGDSTEYQVLRRVGVIRFKNLSKKEDWQLIKYNSNLNKQ